MKIILDDREQQLYHLVNEKNDSLDLKLTIEKKTLPLGDIVFVDDNEKEIVIVERKSLSDLVASIKDGRYEEQSYRLIHSSGLYRHHIIYLIEGGMSQILNPIEKKMIYSSMLTLQLYKGFSIMKTTSMIETAEWIIYSANKLSSMVKKGHELWSPESAIIEQVPSNYCSVVKKTKKDNVTPENIGEIILCQIPGISSVSAITIMKEFNKQFNIFVMMRFKIVFIYIFVNMIINNQYNRKNYRTI